MKAGGKQHFVGVNIPNAGQEPLVQEEAFQPSAPPGQPGLEGRPVDLDWIGAEGPDFIAGIYPLLRHATEKTEFPDVVETQFLVRTGESDDEMGVRVGRRVPPNPEKPAGHFEMEEEGSFPAFEDEDFAPAPDGGHGGAFQGAKIRGSRRPQQLGQGNPHLRDLPARDPGPQPRGDRLYFGQFGHKGHYI